MTQPDVNNEWLGEGEQNRGWLEQARSAELCDMLREPLPGETDVFRRNVKAELDYRRSL